jgi:hypothetical protein
MFAVLPFLLLMLVRPAFADTMCHAGPLSSVIGTVCDTGAIQLDFTHADVGSNNYISTTFGGRVLYSGTQWDVHNFTFTPVDNGFTLAFDGGPQSVPQSATIGGYAVDIAVLHGFQVSALPVGDVLTGLQVSGGALSVSGSGYDSDAAYSGELDFGSPLTFIETYRLTEDFGGSISPPSTVTDHSYLPHLYRSGTGSAEVFNLQAIPVNTALSTTASWDGTPTTYIYDVKFAPEPPAILLLAMVLVWLSAAPTLGRFRAWRASEATARKQRPH